MNAAKSNVNTNKNHANTMLYNNRHLEKGNFRRQKDYKKAAKLFKCP
jgi:hypothetical protein